MTRMQAENNRVLNALDEGIVMAVITMLYKNLVVVVESKSTRESAEYILKEHLNMGDNEIAYWMDFFKV